MNHVPSVLMQKTRPRTRLDHRLNAGLSLNTIVDGVRLTDFMEFIMEHVDDDHLNLNYKLSSIQERESRCLKASNALSAHGAEA